MTSARRRPVRRLAAAAVAAGVCVAGPAAGTGTALAGGVPKQRGGATATLDGLRSHGDAVIRVGAERREVSAGLFEMSVEDGGTLQTYGVDTLRPTQAQARYQEGEAESSPLHGSRNAGRIRWVVQHSYPRVDDLEALAEAAGAERLTASTAAAGTQVAIWRLAGGSRDGSGAPRVSAADAGAEKLADHLVRRARSAPEPRASLALDPAAVSGRTGDRLGPVTVRTNAPGVTVTPGPAATAQGVRIVDERGRHLRSARNGTRLYFAVPDDVDPGTASLTARAATKIPVGRVLTGAGERGRSQAQIVAGSSQSTVAADATVNWAAKGAVPAARAVENCARGGVDITVDNGGDAPFRLRAGDRRREIPGGGTGTVTVPVREDQAYRIPVSGPRGYERVFSGVLNCAASTGAETEGGGLDGQGVTTRSAARPATVGGTGGERTLAGGTDLAETGSGHTPLIAGAALGFVALGAAALVAARQRGNGQA
ncbi:thioester domain-containing protein [Streptomyces boncukensis]|uniref:Cys-Gln thioester bond-forming surface protein n=1 Tax=Streptomyces boncukensis TaxID=2711219 RepID=A0A6G4X4G9_9ACTN|nr:thioester domain-containing protein [Streptomyces boncukensis]NGO71634.1 Cys-Gln thioester bond-forming surface protein [Streptomyces boncukensis]